MSPVERVTIAISVGLVNGAVVAAASIALHLHAVWPGAVFATGMTTILTLGFLRRSR